MDKTEHIIKYIIGDLTKNERAEFSQMLKDDSDFKDEYIFILDIWEFIKKQLKIENIDDSSRREELVAEITAAVDVEKYRGKNKTSKEEEFTRVLSEIIESNEPNFEEKGKKRKLSTQKYSVFILAIAAIFLLFLIPYRDAAELSTKYYNPSFENISEGLYPISRSDKALAVQLFKEGKYKAARSAFEPWNEEEEKDYYIVFFYAISCYETGDTDRSVYYLKSLTSIEDKEINYQSEWYLSLILLKEGKNSEAIKHLKNVSKEAGQYRLESKKLLRRLN